MDGVEYSTPDLDLLNKRRATSLHPAAVLPAAVLPAAVPPAAVPSDHPSNPDPQRYHLNGSVALTTSSQCNALIRGRESSPVIQVNKCVMPAILDANTCPSDLTHVAYRLYQKLRDSDGIRTTPFAGELGPFHDNGDNGSNCVTEDMVRAAVLEHVYQNNTGEFNEHICRMRDYQDFGGFVGRLEEARSSVRYSVLKDCLPGSDIVIPVVHFDELYIQMSLYRLILHIIAPGMCKHLLLPDGNTVVTTLVPGLFLVGGEQEEEERDIHLYWTDPGPAGPLVDMQSYVHHSRINHAPLTDRHLLVLTNGLCFRPSCGRPLQIKDTGGYIERYPDGQGGIAEKILRPADTVLACMTRLSPMAFRELKERTELTVDHVAVNHHHDAPDLLRLATRSEQGRNKIRGRDNGDATSGMTWMTLKDFAAYLLSLRSSAGKGTAAAVDCSSIDEIDTIDSIEGLLLDEKRWVAAGAAAWGRGTNVQEVVTKGQSHESFKAPILPVTNLKIHVNLACARKMVGGLHKYAMSEHGSWHDRYRYPHIHVTLVTTEGSTNRTVPFHILLMTTAAMNLDAFEKLGAARGMLLGSEWDQNAPGVVPFGLAFSRGTDGHMYRHAVVETPEDGWQMVDIDHVHGEVRYARYGGIEMVTHAENVRRASGYFIAATMSFHAGTKSGQTEILPRDMHTCRGFCQWIVGILALSSPSSVIWWWRRLSNGNHTPGDLVPVKARGELETAIIRQRVVLDFTVDGVKMCASPGEGGDTVVYSGDVSSVVKRRAKENLANPWMLVRFCEEHPVATILYGEQGCLDFICDQLHDPNLRLDPATTDKLVKKMRTKTHTERWPLLHHLCYRERYVFRPLCHARDRNLMGHVSSDRLLAAVLAADAEAAAIADVRTHYNGAFSGIAKVSPDKEMCPSTRKRLHDLSCSKEPGKIRLPTNDVLKRGIPRYVITHLYLEPKCLKPKDTHIAKCTSCFAYAVVHTLGDKKVDTLWNLGLSKTEKDQAKKLVQALVNVRGTLEAMLTSVQPVEDMDGALLEVMRQVTEPLCLSKPAKGPPCHQNDRKEAEAIRQR